MSEVVPEDEDRGGDGAMAGAVDDDALKDTVGGPGGSDDADEVGGIGSHPGPTDDEEGGTGADDGGPGSQNM